MNLSLMTVELSIAALGLIILALGLIVPEHQKKGIGIFSVLALVVILGITVFMRGTEGFVFGHMYQVDVFGTFFKIVFITSAILVSIFSISFIEKIGYNKSEFFALIVFATLGMIVMACATDFVTLFIGLELMTISFVILTSFRLGDKKSSEAGMKYILLSAMSSGVLLYGMSLVFGLTQSVEYGAFTEIFASGNLIPMMVLAMVMILAGFAFKLSLVPFHMWAPDIYEGAPTPVTALLSTGSKVAALAALIRFMTIAAPDSTGSVTTLLILLSALTILLGNFVAIPQTNIKRMLAYSSIAHAGYLMLGLLAFNEIGIAAMMYYVVVYIFANVGVFAAITVFGDHTGSDEIKDYRGMWKRSPFISMIMLASLLSLAGIPPLAGFFGKFYIFIAIINEGYIWLAFLAIMMSMVSVYYYLIVVKVMFIGDADEDADSIPIPAGSKAVMVFCAVMSLLLGIFQSPLTDWVTGITSMFLSL